MHTYKIEQVPSEDNEKLSIQIHGELTLKNSGHFYGDLKNIKKVYKKYDILLKDVTRIDLSCIQVIYAFMIHLQKNKKEVIFKKELTGEIEKLLTTSDLLNH